MAEVGGGALTPQAAYPNDLTKAVCNVLFPLLLLRFIRVTEGRNPFGIIGDALQAHARAHHPEVLDRSG